MNCKNFQHWLSARSPEKDAPVPDSIAEHLKICTECQSMYMLDKNLDKAIEAALDSKTLPRGLHERIDQSLDLAPDHTKPSRAFSWYKITAAAVILSAISIIIIFSIFSNQPFRYKNLHQISEAAVALHLKGNTKMSFSSENIKTALVMLSRKLEFNIIVPDMEGQGFVLLGGRLCALGKCKIAYLFYKKEDKLCSLLIMNDNHLDFELTDGSRFDSTIKGLHSNVWKRNGQVYAMVY